MLGLRAFSHSLASMGHWPKGTLVDRVAKFIRVWNGFIWNSPGQCESILKWIQFNQAQPPFKKSNQIQSNRFKLSEPLSEYLKQCWIIICFVFILGNEFLLKGWVNVKIFLKINCSQKSWMQSNPESNFAKIFLFNPV